MNKIIVLLIVCFLFSCENKKDILLPKASVSVTTEVLDNSPIYIFYKIEGKDTIADVNRKNSIISTNWLLNIDKRLPLKTVVPEVMKLQEKKRQEKAHKNEKAENYYSYADSINKKIAFIPFTKVYYKTEKPTQKSILYFSKNNTIVFNNRTFKKEEILQKLDSITTQTSDNIVLGFDKNLDFGSYIQLKIMLRNNFDGNETSEEFIY